jgi:hypothetical protein
MVSLTMGGQVPRGELLLISFSAAFVASLLLLCLPRSLVSLRVKRILALVWLMMGQYWWLTLNWMGPGVTFLFGGVLLCLWGKRGAVWPSGIAIIFGAWWLFTLVYPPGLGTRWSDDGRYPMLFDH